MIAPISTLFAALAALLLAAAPASGQEVRKFTLADTVTIETVDWENGRLTATTHGGEPRDVLVDGDTRVVVGSETVAPTKLAPGDRVVIEARKEQQGDSAGDALVADRLVIAVDPELNASGRDTTLGRVLATDATTGTLTVETGGHEGPIDFRVAADAVTIEGTPANLAELEPGDRVAVVHAETTATGSASPIEAREVRVERAAFRPVQPDAAGEPMLREDG